MLRSTDNESSRQYFQVDRFFQQNGEWFYMTREGSERGPFPERSDAEADLLFYIMDVNRKQALGIAL